MLGDSRLALLFSARMVSVLGDGFGRVALAFAVLGLPGATATGLSIVLACQSVPLVILIAFGGVVADHYPRRLVLIVADVLAGLAWTGLSAMFLTGHAPIAAVSTLAAVGGIATALFLPAYDGIVPELVASPRRQRANGAMKLANNVGLAIGVALAGAVVAGVGARWAVAINALSFFVSAALIAVARIPGRTPGMLPRPVARLREGWREFASRQWLWAVALPFAAVVASLNAYMGVLGPVVAGTQLGGAPAWSAILAAQVVGALVGIPIAIRLRPRRPALVAALTTGAWAVPMFLLGSRSPLALIVVGAFFAGMIADIFGILWVTALQREIPGPALSRVMSWDRVSSLALAPLGVLIAGPAATRFGAQATLVGFAIVVLGSMVAACLVPGVRRLTVVD